MAKEKKKPVESTEPKPEPTPEEAAPAEDAAKQPEPAAPAEESAPAAPPTEPVAEEPKQGWVGGHSMNNGKG